MKKKMIGMVAMFIVGCGAIMEKKVEPITISTAKNVDAFDYEGNYLGTGNTFSIDMCNRDGRGGNEIILKEINNPSNEYVVEMQREFNKQSLWNFTVDLGIISYPLDYSKGSNRRLAKKHYQVGDFNELGQDAQLDTDKI